jgi:hypothetical protein
MSAGEETTTLASLYLLVNEWIIRFGLGALRYQETLYFLLLLNPTDLSLNTEPRSAPYRTKMTRLFSSNPTQHSRE